MKKNTKVNCDVETCKHNDDHECCLEELDISCTCDGEECEEIEETICNNFEKEESDDDCEELEYDEELDDVEETEYNDEIEEDDDFEDDEIEEEYSEEITEEYIELEEGKDL